MAVRLNHLQSVVEKENGAFRLPFHAHLDGLEHVVAFAVVAERSKILRLVDNDIVVGKRIVVEHGFQFSDKTSVVGFGASANGTGVSVDGLNVDSRFEPIALADLLQVRLQKRIEAKEENLLSVPGLLFRLFERNHGLPGAGRAADCNRTLVAEVVQYVRLFPEKPQELPFAVVTFDGGRGNDAERRAEEFVEEELATITDELLSTLALLCEIIEELLEFALSTLTRLQFSSK